MKFNNVHLVGAGGTGSIVLEPLIRLLTYHPNGTTNINVHDADHYSESNSTRQLFDPEFLDKNKAEALVTRYQHICPSLVAHPHYLTAERLIRNIEDFPLLNNLLVILAVDNERSRHNIIKALDSTHNSVNFAVILPGNEFHTASCLVYTRVNGETKFPHPFDTVTNYANPSDQEPGSCGYESVSSPQLICANFGSALNILEYTYALLEDKPMPFRVNYDGETRTMAPEGRRFI